MYNADPVNVQKNIDRIVKNIEDMKSQLDEMDRQKKSTQDEVLRLEGCLIVFKGFREAGIVDIAVPNKHHEHDDHHEHGTEFVDEIRCLR